jgi:hypothetical protein
MITEQVKELDECAKKCQQYPFINVCMNNEGHDFRFIFRNAADTIKTLSEKVRAANMERSTAYYNGGWIPVSERLPESGKEVLVWYEYWSDKRESLVQTFGISFYWNTWCGDVMGIKARCIAWRPLPEPYREDGETDETNN